MGVDFDLLRQELSSVVVEGDQERYCLDWVGKREAMLTANAPIAKTLRPLREQSVDFDTTQNLFIEGDNLDALKLLQESYLDKVKMIYIDPPYNTGNDFIYKDNFAESTQTFLERSEQIDEEGNRLVANTESNGRYHSDWLSMMYSRLKLARNLLTDDGAIFISIDDNEVDNISRLLKELFGGEQVEIYIWDTRERGQMPKTAKNTVRKEHEYIVTAFKKAKQLNKYSSLKYADNEGWTNPDNDPRGNWMSANISRGSGEATGGSKSFTITNPAGISFHRDWSISEQEYQDLLADNRIYFADNGKGVPRKKIFQNEPVDSIQSSFFADLSSSQSAAEMITEMFDSKVFDYPKPVNLIKRFISIAADSNDIIMDFFAGSATTAHAVMELNSEDGGDRKFILAQLPEILDVNKAPNAKAKVTIQNAINFCQENNLPTTIAEISKERIRRAGAKIKAENADQAGIGQLDTGFRVLKVDDSNMQDVYYRPQDLTLDLVAQMVDHIKSDRSDEDLLFQVMLDLGLELSLPIECRQIDGQDVYFVAGNSLVACFNNLSMAIIDEVATIQPLYFVSCERAIQQDHDKANFKERFGRLSHQTDVRFI